MHESDERRNRERDDEEEKERPRPIIPFPRGLRRDGKIKGDDESADRRRRPHEEGSEKRGSIEDHLPRDVKVHPPRTGGVL